MTLEERLTEGARRVQEILDEDFLRFQSVLFQAYPDIDVDGLHRRDGVLPRALRPREDVVSCSSFTTRSMHMTNADR